jgi:molybdopterin molybdotransferase
MSATGRDRAEEEGTTVTLPVPWLVAREVAYRAGCSARPAPAQIALSLADGLTLAEPLRALTDLPAFATSSVDGFAVRGTGPWRLTGRVLAGTVASPVGDGECVEIATGAMVPPGTEHILRVEKSTVDNGLVRGQPGTVPEWRKPGDEASTGDELLPPGTPVTPGVLGLAAMCGYDTLTVTRSPRVAVVVFGDELLTAGHPGDGRVRDALGPQLPGWLRRYDAFPVSGPTSVGPVADTFDAHVAAIRAALDQADLVCTTGGTMHGPVDHLHSALAELGARYLVNTVGVRPGFPMLLAEVEGAGAGGGRGFVAGLPGNPQSAVVALVSLVAPLLAGAMGRPSPTLPMVELGAPVRGRGADTHLALVRIDPDGIARPMEHAGSAMLRGLAGADGFAVIAAQAAGAVGDRVPFIALPTGSGPPRASLGGDLGGPGEPGPA